MPNENMDVCIIIIIAKFHWLPANLVINNNLTLYCRDTEVMIQRAIETLEKSYCVQFVPRTNAQDYAVFEQGQK